MTHDISEAISMADKIIVLTNRPASVKRVHFTHLEHISTPLKRREDSTFSVQFEQIWQELNNYETNRQLSIEHKGFEKTRLRKVLVLACQIGFLVLFLLLWELAARFNWIDAFIFSSPSRIWKQLGALSQTGDLWKHIFVSTKETVLGFLIATVLGTLVAVVLWWSKSLQDIFEPYLVVLNSLPKIALGPIIIIWVGAGEKAIVTMAVLISVIITTISMLNGFIGTSPDKVLLLKTMNASKFQIFTKLVFPSNIPTLLSTLKINVGLSWVGTIMGEYLNSKAGLGYLIVYGGQVFKLDLVMACTVVLCVLAAIMYLVVALMENSL